MVRALNGRTKAERGFAGEAIFALALSLSAALVFCGNNTPLGPSIGSDNAMYLTMGTALARGYAPYLDIFDHKGPLLFLIETLPQLFFGGYRTVTVFLMEAATLFLSLAAVQAMCRALGLGRAWPAQLVYLALLMPRMCGGNLSEEYACLFTLLGLLAMLRAFSGEWKPLFGPAAFAGAMAALAFLTRANNALPLAFAALGAAAWLLASREFARLGACAAGFAIGAAAVSLPVALWLASYGEGALEAAFYGAITHNLLYSQTGDGSSRVAMLLLSAYGHAALLMALLSCLGAAACYARTRHGAVPLAMLACAAAAGLAAFISHKFYQHYLMLGAPCAALGAAQILRWARGRGASFSRALRLAAAGVSIAALLLYGAQANGTRLAEREGWAEFCEDAQALYAAVPEEDRDSFMAYRVEPKWYVATGALPCMRFYFLQEILGEADPRVMDEIVETFESNPPRWLVLFYNRPFSPPYDERVAEIFRTRYAFVDARGEYQLLKLVEK